VSKEAAVLFEKQHRSNQSEYGNQVMYEQEVDLEASDVY